MQLSLIDAYFIQRIATKIMLLKYGLLKLYNGNYDYFMSKSKNESRQTTGGIDLISIHNRILKLECELAYVGGKLNERLSDDEKKNLNEDYLKIAKELNKLKRLL
jgi:ATPase subunit of ABC transporter with duplicated ATPase domains